MALVTRIPARPSTVPSAALTADQFATITMLRGRGHITERDAARLAAMPDRLGEIIVLVMLHERRDLTDVEYEIEKAEQLRPA